MKLALIGADAAVFVVEPDAHRIIQMDTLLRYTEQIGISRLVFVNKMDKPDINFAETLNVLNIFSGSKTPRPLAPLHYPIESGSGLSGYVDVLKKEAFKFSPDGKAQKISIPGELEQEVDAAREKLIESLADTDDTLLEMVLEGKEPPQDLLEKDLKQAVKAGTSVPILVGSAHTDAGVLTLLDTIVSLCPSPSEREYKDKAGKPIQVKADGPVIVQVIKTYIHPQSGKLSVARVITGTVNADTTFVDTAQKVRRSALADSTGFKARSKRLCTRLVPAA